MTEAFGAGNERYPCLSSVSTAYAQTERDYLCPAGVSRILCASSGGCTLVTSNRSVRLIGARMAIMTGEIRYRLSEPTDDLLLTRLDFTMAPGSGSGLSLAVMRASFPELDRLRCRPGEWVVFYDNYDLVMTSVKNLHAFSAVASPERELQIALMLAFLLCAVATSSWDEDLGKRSFNCHVRAALQYIHENYMCAITAEDVAAFAGINVGHLHRIFLSETGFRVGEYLTDLRIRKAKSLLMRTDIPTSSVASRVGISTLQYFCRLFKQKVGMTPQTFRRSYAVTCGYVNRDFYVQDNTIPGFHTPGAEGGTP